jgi:pyruvate kinase
VRIRLFRGDPLLLAADGAPGRDAQRGEDGQIIEPASITCSHAEAIDALRPGHTAWIDDGKIGAIVESVDRHTALLRVTEAAHVPVIWATQVLVTLVKRGAKSRPEITDAAISMRAECVMLNKGDYILDALRVLGNILSRMEAHQHKKA